MFSDDHHRLDSPPPASQYRRPWSPDSYDSIPVRRSLDGDRFAPRLHQYYQYRREPSDVSVEALDLADYALTLRPHHAGYSAQEALHQDIYTPSPRRLRPFPSRDSFQPPSLVSRGGTTSPSSAPLSRPFSLPPPTRHSGDTQSFIPYIAHQTPPPGEPEIDISQFPAWSRNWYKSEPANSSDTHTPYFDKDEAKRSLFDPGYNHSYPSDFHSLSSPHAFSSVESSRDILPWTNDPPAYGPPIDAGTKQERLRMLEREFGAKVNGKEGLFEDAVREPVIGSVDNHGKLVTQGPKKRIATRAAQMLLTLAAAIPSIYAALIIKPSSPPPPQSKLPAFALYFLSVLTFLALFYLFCMRPCCCGGKRTKPGGLTAEGMIVLPVQGLPGKGRKKNKGRKGKKGGNSDVQVNLIVDPDMFRGRRENGDSEEEDEDHGGSIPGGFESRRHARRRPRRSVFAGLAMEEQWRSARGWLKKIMAFDVMAVVIWGAVFLLILMGKRCPSGQFNGWCDAYNVASAAACLLCVSFGLSTFFDIKDLHASKASPRTRT